MKIVGNVIIYCALFLIFTFSGLGSQSSHSGFTFGGFFIALMVAFPMLVLGAWFVGKHEQVAQATSDAEAQTLLPANSGLKPESFFLYLRPFVSTNAYRLSDSHLNLFSWELWERDGFDDIERILARALRPTAKFVALGKPGEHRGAARILTTEKAWQVELAALAEKATLIVLMPSSRPGTLWEVSYLKERSLFGKVVCIMPPSDNGFYIATEPNTEEEWNRTRSACSKLGIPMPDHIPGGALFMLDQTTKKIALQPLPQPNPVAWMKSIQKLLDACHSDV